MTAPTAGPPASLSDLAAAAAAAGDGLLLLAEAARAGARIRRAAAEAGSAEARVEQAAGTDVRSSAVRVMLVLGEAATLEHLAGILERTVLPAPDPAGPGGIDDPAPDEVVDVVGRTEAARPQTPGTP